MSKTLKKYWQSYGGFKALMKSPFLWLSFLMTIISYEFFLDEKWLDIPISMLPSLLGFNLASYSVWLAFGNHKLNKILSKLKEGQLHSRYMEVNSSFIHFILAQILCLILVVLLKTNSLNNIIYLPNLACFNFYMKFLEYGQIFINGFIFFLFCYCLFSMLAAVLGFIGIASGLDIIYRQESKEEIQTKRLNQQNIIQKEKEKELLNQKIKEELELLKVQKIKEELELSILQKAKNELELLIAQKNSSIKPTQEKIKNIIGFFKSK
ncbi:MULTISPECIES: hypothetical protein [Acinetobacter calcoaceticus/baumannii complex]|jgi:hypothetical protein|uniref:hypothetical protein n=1 Tax=Acinetobacter calcoaceticus/baumannii complex TaxID=909768 RepID=UPI001F16220A|nr:MULTISPECIES: hypothetical protein [Acinetobacter calcoaceticus/baumannii complex]MCE6082878.1 hypothetical protein [Acinetobacter pittii]MDR9610078.1 hypothetical protein [Acinetobacter baumannii]WVH54244.1 hypothetical protein RQL83_19470 [Acinetobacter pittii]